MSRQGKTENAIVGNLRDCEPGLQASIWLTIAESSAFRREPFRSYERAIGILRNEDSPAILEALLSYARWMLGNSFGFQKVLETLLEVDMLAKGFLERARPGVSQDLKSNVSGSTFRSDRSCATDR